MKKSLIERAMIYKEYVSFRYCKKKKKKKLKILDIKISEREKKLKSQMIH